MNEDNKIIIENVSSEAEVISDFQIISKKEINNKFNLILILGVSLLSISISIYFYSLGLFN